MRKSFRTAYGEWQLPELLQTHSGLSLRPCENGLTVIAGDIEFTAQYADHEEITDSYQVEIRVPRDFPRSLPTVRELRGRIPKTFHTQPDGTLCLGSPVRLQLEVRRRPTLPSFVTRCLIPYLYGFTYKERHGKLPQGELTHGRKGLIQDYMALFHLASDSACLEMIHLASFKKRVANKKPCFCGSGIRLGRCHNRKVNDARRRLGRTWCSQEYARLKR